MAGRWPSPAALPLSRPPPPRIKDTRPCAPQGRVVLPVSNVLFAEVVLDQFHQRLDSLFLIGAVGDQRNGGALHDAQGQNAQQALGIDAAILLFNPDAALELICFLDKERVYT